MKLFNLALSLGVAAALGACSSTPPAPAVTASPQAPAAAPAATPPAAANAAASAPVLPAHLDPKSPISAARSVFFGFDQYTVDSTQFAVLERHSAYLKANPSLKVTIEGNTDERGGAEYNLALGQKRADAVTKALTTFGVKPSQMEAVSWGREKPKAMGHDEAAWAQNRRVDIQYPAK